MATIPDCLPNTGGKPLWVISLMLLDKKVLGNNQTMEGIHGKKDMDLRRNRHGASSHLGQYKVSLNHFGDVLTSLPHT